MAHGLVGIECHDKLSALRAHIEDLKGQIVPELPLDLEGVIHCIGIGWSRRQGAEMRRTPRSPLGTTVGSEANNR